MMVQGYSPRAGIVEVRMRIGNVEGLNADDTSVSCGEWRTSCVSDH